MGIVDKINEVGNIYAVSAEEVDKALKKVEETCNSAPTDVSSPDEEADDEVKYVLTEWGCLSCVLTDYGFDTHRISGKVGRHIVEDFMELMCNAGHVIKNSEIKED